MAEEENSVVTKEESAIFIGGEINSDKHKTSKTIVPDSNGENKSVLANWNQLPVVAGG